MPAKRVILCIMDGWGIAPPGPGIAVGIGADYAEFGAPNRVERVAKYNRLSFIQEYLTAQGK